MLEHLYAELAKKICSKSGTIHVRVEKMKQAGIITGTRVDISEKQLGFDVLLLYWHHFKSAKDYHTALDKL